MTLTELFLVAMIIIFATPFLIWRLGGTDYHAPLVVVQILAGILLGPGMLGAAFPGYYALVFDPAVVQALNGIAWWAVMVFVWLAGIELDLAGFWAARRDTLTTAGLALVVPMVLGAAAGGLLLLHGGDWRGAQAARWQFVLGVGMACAVTALPILVLLMEKLGILRTTLGQRVLRYASLDDIAIWAVLALILLDWSRIGRQLLFIGIFLLATALCRRFIPKLDPRDRWHVAILWLLVCALGADWCGLHFMVGAFLAGAIMERGWFGETALDTLRHHVLLFLMPVFFLSTGLRTHWSAGGLEVLSAAGLLLLVAVAGKHLGLKLAGRLLGWPRGEAGTIAWLLQTKALIMIIFANILLDKGVITASTFTALLLMAVGSTMLTIPMVTPRLGGLKIAPGE